MHVLGANLGSTKRGRKLRDGGACLVGETGPIVAIAEERLTRRKHDGGFTRSMPYCLDYLRSVDSTINNIELSVVTSCCEAQRTPESAASSVASLLGSSRRFPVETVSHHLAHAYSAFWPSPFDEALVVVMDCGGNALSDSDPADWWTAPREQASYYVADGSGITLIGRDFDEPYAAGFGEIYRAFTHCLGWPSSIHSSKTMALAAQGDRRFQDTSLYSMEKGRLISSVVVDPYNPEKMVQQALDSLKIPFVGRRERDFPITQEYKNLAELVQFSLYNALRSRVEILVKQTGIRHVCFAGGVALNCVAVGRLVDDGVVDKVFVQPAAGDTGQCLGAAFVALERRGGKRPCGRHGQFSPFLGRGYSTEDVESAMTKLKTQKIGIDIHESGNLATVARLLAKGAIVAFFSGRSEFGPRALGARSILADPRDKDVRKRLLSIKSREDFSPFAPSVLSTSYSQFFESAGSSTMTVAVSATAQARHDIPNIVHDDNSARVQIVDDRDGSRLSALLAEFKKETGIGVLVNTSLNLVDEPIVETPTDCIDLFLRSDIDCVYLDGRLVVKQNWSNDVDGQNHHDRVEVTSSAQLSEDNHCINEDDHRLVGASRQ